MHDFVIKTYDFYLVNCMHLLNIIVYWYAPNTTRLQQIFQVHSTQTDELIDSMFVYVPRFGCYGTHHVIWGAGDKKL